MTLKTLSKITRALLYALMVLVAALMAALFVSADVRTFMENEYGAAGSTVLFYAMLLVCGGIALWILIELAAVLKTVESDPFVERNAAAFMRMGIAAEAAGLVFFVKCFFVHHHDCRMRAGDDTQRTFRAHAWHGVQKGR